MEPTESRIPPLKTSIDPTTAVLQILIEETRAQAVMARNLERRTQEYFETLQQGAIATQTSLQQAVAVSQRRGYPSPDGSRTANARIRGTTDREWVLLGDDQRIRLLEPTGVPEEGTGGR